MKDSLKEERMAVDKAILQLMAKAAKNKKEIIEITGIHSSTFKRIFSENREPTLEELEKITEACNTKFFEMMCMLYPEFKKEVVLKHSQTFIVISEDELNLLVNRILEQYLQEKERKGL